MRRLTPLHAALGTMFLALTFSAVPVLADAADMPAGVPAAKSTYEQERQRCLAGQSGQALETCLREAGAAKQQGTAQLTKGDANLARDARQRCDALDGSQKRDCLARVEGAPNTTSSGSVQSGGVLRETVTTVPAPIPAPAPAPAAMPKPAPATSPDPAPPASR